jgi:hypothetical protein
MTDVNNAGVVREVLVNPTAAPPPPPGGQSAVTINTG